MGYDFIGALLELSDNSARRNCKSSNIDVVAHADQKQLSRVSVIDDGKGMSFEELKQAVVFNLLKQRDDGDIGKFHVGLKYAAIVIGDLITILSLQANGKVSGIHLNITQMKELDTFTPTDVREEVDQDWALKHIHPSDYAKFSKQASGTIVSVSALTAMCKRPIEKVRDELLKILPFSYSMLYNDCCMNLYEADKKITTIKPYDMFYQSTPENLDEPAYETELRVYRDLAGMRVFEVNKNKRSVPKKNGGHTKGTARTPAYYEFTPYVVGKKGHQNNMSGQVSSLPDSSTLISSIQLRFVQVNQETFNSEKDLFPEGSKLHTDRKGVYFIREIRQVCSAHQLGKKMPDRSVMAIERQRCLVTFKSDADDLVGSKYNKQMDGLLALPCAALNDAIYAIYKQVTNPWTKKHPGKKKQEAESDDEEEDQEAEAEEASDEQSDSSDASVSAPNVADMMRSNTIVDAPVVAASQQPLPVSQAPSLKVSEQSPTDETPLPKKAKKPASPVTSEDDEEAEAEAEEDETSSVTSSVPSPDDHTNDILALPPPAPTPVYTDSVVNGDLVFSAGSTVHTLKAPPCVEQLYAWFSALKASDVNSYKKYLQILVQAQEFS